MATDQLPFVQRPPVQPKLRSAYDLQRERIKAETSEEDQRRQEAMQRQLATQGLKAGSGLAEKQMREQDIQSRIEAARKLGNVDIAESQAREVSDEAEKQRKFISSERTGTQDYSSREAALNRALQEKQVMGSLSLEQQKVANQAAQFGTEQQFKAYALERGLSDEQAKRAWQSQENQKQLGSTEKLAFAGLSLKEKELAQQANQFGSEQEFKRYALKAGLDDNQADRAWKGAQAEAERGLKREDRYANLSVEQKKLAQQAEQFKSEQEYKKYALEAGISDEQADRAWRSKEAEAARDFEGSESQMDRLAAQEQFYAGLSLEERKVANQADQFTSEQDFKRYALEAGLDENEADRIWKSQESESDRNLERSKFLKDLSFKEKELAQQASQFKSEDEFKRYAIESGYDEAETQRVWQASQNQINSDNDIALARVQSQLSMGEMRLQDTLGQAKEMRLATAKQYYDMGLSGRVIEGKELAMLSSNDPMAYSAYMDGQAGKSMDDFNRDYSEQIDRRNALVSSAALNDPKLMGAINALMTGNMPLKEDGSIDWDKLVATDKVAGTVGFTPVPRYSGGFIGTPSGGSTFPPGTATDYIPWSRTSG